jgi:hypothetical protein
MPKREITTAARRAQVASRYLLGELQAAIAESFGVDQAQISRDLKIIRQQWLESAIRDFDAARAEELAKIDLVEREAWAAWARSQEEKEIASQQEQHDPIVWDDAQGKPQITYKIKKRISMRKEGQAGAPAFLEVVLKCIAKRCEILGLDAPQRFTIRWEDLTPEQEDRLARGEPVEKVLAA